MTSIIRLIAILDDKAGFQSGDFGGEARGLYAAENFIKIFVGGGGFVLWIRAAVGQDVGGVE